MAADGRKWRRMGGSLAGGAIGGGYRACVRSAGCDVRPPDGRRMEGAIGGGSAGGANGRARLGGAMGDRREYDKRARYRKDLYCAP